MVERLALSEPGSIAERIRFAIAQEKLVRERPSDSAEIEVWRDVLNIACAFGYSAESNAWFELLGVATFRFDPAKMWVTAYPEPDVDSALVHEAYRHAALPIALHYFGAEVLHASAIRTARGVVAFCAVSETGKSTIAAALSARGYSLWADDAVALEVGERPPVHTIRLPFDLRLRSASAAYLGVDASALPARVSPTSEFATSPLAALCILERIEPTLAEVTIEQIPPARALAALLPHAFSFSLKDPLRKRLMFQRYMRIAAGTPTFRVSFAPGFERLPFVLDAIEQSIDAFAGGPYQHSSPNAPRDGLRARSGQRKPRSPSARSRSA